MTISASDFRVKRTRNGRFYVQVKCWWGLSWADCLRCDECDSRVEFSSLAEAVAWIEGFGVPDEVVWPQPDWRSAA